MKNLQLGIALTALLILTSCAYKKEKKLKYVN